jgi:uncharacterized protein (UPF0303 family)
MGMSAAKGGAFPITLSLWIVIGTLLASIISPSLCGENFVVGLLLAATKVFFKDRDNFL